MSDKKPVVIYGANGFSGRLIAEFLREYNVPFIAAGRSRARLEDVMKHVPASKRPAMTSSRQRAQSKNSLSFFPERKWSAIQPVLLYTTARG